MTITLSPEDVQKWKNEVEEVYRKVNIESIRELINDLQPSPFIVNTAIEKYKEKLSKVKLPKLITI